MRYVLLACALALLPLAASAKTMLGVLHHGSSVVNFVLAGNTVIIEEQEAGGTRDDTVVQVKDMGCTGVGTDHTITMQAKGLKMRRDEVSKSDVYVFSTQKSGARTWVFNRDEDADAFALAAKLNRLAHCK
jgi:hypothetical protein